MGEKTLILGHSRETRKIAEALLQQNKEVIVALSGDSSEAVFVEELKVKNHYDRVEILPITGSFSCNGSVGHFDLTINDKEPEPFSRTVSTIVLADDIARKPNFDLYGVRESNTVVSLSRARELIESGLIEPKSDGLKRLVSEKRIAFITGLADESNPIIAEEVMRLALLLQQKFNSFTYIFTGNLKVAANGLEILYRQTKKAGTIYIKCAETVPNIEIDKNGTLNLTYVDEVIRETCKLNLDLTVIDETLKPSPFTKHVAKLLNIDTGPDGFGQSDNVHRATVLTNRRGIFVAGFSRRVQPAVERQADAENVALAIINLYKNPPEEKKGKAEINVAGHCIRCLTCFRVCPHDAIFVNSKVNVNPRACEGCGICETECPRFAINIEALDDEPISERIPNGGKNIDSGDIGPSITAFCCSRSAKEARNLAVCMGRSLPTGLNIVEVPCAGSVSMDHLFSAFKKGADGVLVLSCHEGNCHSEYGNTYAHHRVDQVTDLLTQIGIERGRLNYRTLASNMGIEFAETVCHFEKVILKLGPSRVKGA